MRKSRESVFLLQLFHYSIYFFNFCLTDSCHPPAQEYIQPITHPKQPMNISQQLQAEKEYEYRCHSVVKISPTLLLYCHEDATHSLNGSRLRRRAVCRLSIALWNILRFYASAPHWQLPLWQATATPELLRLQNLQLHVNIHRILAFVLY